MDKPNILFILNDHQAYYGHGRLAGSPDIKRPNFEKLAAEGVKFTRAYTVSPVCGPARRSMLNGLYPHTHGEIKNDSNIPFEEETYLEKLAKAGYKNYYYGKWHAGPGTAHDHYCDGFSYESYGNPYVTPEYKQYLKNNNLPYFQVKVLHSFWVKLKKGDLYEPKLSMLTEDACGIMTTPKETHETFFLASLACNKLEQISCSKNKQPFHLRVDFWAPHQPFFPDQESFDKYNPNKIIEYPNFGDDLKTKPEIYRYDHHFRISKNNRIIYPNPLPWSEWQEILSCNYAEQTLLDEAGGIIINKLEELGLSNNTIVVWTADHGDSVACHGGHFDKNAYMPEEMVRIPLAIRYPGEIQKAQVCDELVSNLDLPLTFLEFAKTSFSKHVDGESLFPLLLQNEINWRKDLMCETHGHFTSHLGRLIVNKRYKYIYNEGDMDELYDLEEDPFEMNNLIEDNGYSDLLIEMKARLKVWREKTNDNVARNMIKGKRLKGKLYH